jgi:hypothetical protein
MIFFAVSLYFPNILKVYCPHNDHVVLHCCNSGIVDSNLARSMEKHVRVFLYLDVLYRYRFCDWPISRRRGPTKCLSIRFFVYRPNSESEFAEGLKNEM